VKKRKFFTPPSLFGRCESRAASLQPPGGVMALPAELHPYLLRLAFADSAIWFHALSNLSLLGYCDLECSAACAVAGDFDVVGAFRSLVVS